MTGPMNRWNTALLIGLKAYKHSVFARIRSCGYRLSCALSCNTWLKALEIMSVLS
jgi:hypothetical protein